MPAVQRLGPGGATINYSGGQLRTITFTKLSATRAQGSYTATSGGNYQSRVTFDVTRQP